MMSEAYSIPVGSRFKLLENNHRGQVMYIGRVPEVGKGYYVGLKLDEPYGKNDGSYIFKKEFWMNDILNVKKTLAYLWDQIK